MLSDKRNNKVISKAVLQFMHVSTHSTVNFGRYDPINTAPVFPAGDRFLTSTHQKKKKTIPSFPVIHSPPWWSLVHRRKRTDYSFIPLTNKQEALRLWVRMEEGAELWIGRRGLWLGFCPPSPSSLEGAGWGWGRTWCAQERGKQNFTLLRWCPDQPRPRGILQQPKETWKHWKLVLKAETSNAFLQEA